VRNLGSARRAFAGLAPLLICACVLAAPAASQIASPGVVLQASSWGTYLCGKDYSSNYSCLSRSGYHGQSVWGSWGPGHNCVSYVAYRLSQLGPRPWGGNIGNAIDWKGKAQGASFAVNGTPAVGAVAWYGSRVGSAGHIAYVESVSAGSIVVTEDNYVSDTSGYDDTRQIAVGSSGWPDAFLHIYDFHAIAESRNKDGRLETHYEGTDGRIYFRHQTSAGGGWSPESVFGGAALAMAAATNADGRLELFYIGTDNRVYHRWQKSPGGSWSGESWLGGYGA
jgi:surface antigen